MRRTKLFFLTTVMAVVMSASGPSRAASLDNGVCFFTVTIEITGAATLKSVASLQLTPDYSIGFARAGDFDVAQAGTQNCLWVVGGSPTAIASDISATPTDSDSVFDTQTCELMTGEGTLTQDFPVVGPPDAVGAGYDFQGTLTAMHMAITGGLSFIATVAMENPFGQLSWTSCLGGGVDPISFTAVEFFQDPQV